MQKRRITNDDLGVLFFLAALLFGVWFRISPPLTAGFPINDGGLFYVNIESLQSNHYRLPELIHYNGMDIPFVYPPFAFYLTGLLTDVFHLNLINTMQWLPAIVLILSIPAVYILAKHLLKSKLQSGIAVFFYALLPRSITWMIMGGGVTRSLGHFFYILAAIQIYLIFTQNKKKHLLYAIFFSALVCITHPEAIIHTITTAAILWVQYGRNKTGIRNSLIVAFGTLVLTSPWWLTILLRFGIAPFQSATQTSFHSVSNLLLPFTLFSDERFLPLIAPFAILGIGYMLARKEYLLPALYFVPLYIEPRFAFNISIIPMACLASAALCELVLPVLATIESKLRNIESTAPMQSRAERFVLFVFALNLLFGMQLAATEYSQNRVSLSIRQAYEWVKSNTRADKTFLLLTGVEGVLNDPVNEWFPALAERQSVTTAQGTEWLGNNIFVNKLLVIHETQKCRNDINPLMCADTAATKMGIDYDYIFFTLPESQGEFSIAPNIDEYSEFQVVYFKNDVLILKKIHSGSEPK